MKKKSLFATRPLHNLAPNRSEKVLIRMINTSTTASVSLILRVLRQIGETRQTITIQVTAAPAQSLLRGFFVGDAEEFQVAVESDAPHIVLSVWGIDAVQRVVKEHRVLHSQMSWVR